MKSYMKQNGMRLAFVALLIFASAIGLIEPSTAMMGGAVLSFETVSGTTIGCTTAAPATYDAAGYGATSMVYSNIGEITDIGGEWGDIYNEVTHSPISTGEVIKKMGSKNLGAGDLTVAWDQSDAGQDMCRTANGNRAILTFKITKQSGAVRYFTAQVSKFAETFGGGDSVNNGSITLLRQKPIVQDPA